MKLTLKDGSVLEISEKKITGMEAAKRISENLARNAVCVKLDARLADLSEIIDSDCSFEVITLKDAEGLDVYRHTTAHVLAQAVKSIYPTCKLAIGPTIENGFYYDFDFKTPINKDDLEKIEAEMEKIIKADFPIERFTLSRRKALELMKGYDEPYKVQLIEDLPEGERISFYRQGSFVDLCRGPHLPSTGKIKVFKLISLTGAYWRGSEKNKMLTRIYATAFEKKSALDAYINALEDAKKRDHNKLGRELGIFMTDENIGQGLPLLMPKGAKLFQILNRFIEDEEAKRGYVLTKTPYMAKSAIYKISGHWDHYQDGMFVLGKEGTDDEVLALRPMTCPFQYTIYNNGIKSYRDLPQRYGETSTLFRNEASGEMHGLLRIRQFTISEGHIVCMPSQLEQEFRGCLDLARYVIKCLGLESDVSYRFSKWDPKDKKKYIDDPVAWEFAEGEMKRILDHIGLDYSEGIGEAAFYGPKLDIQIKNVYGKEDTMVTLQIDMFLAERFDMSYVDETGEKKRPYIIHRTSLGCYERTIALLIEKYAGAFPVWMAPTQVKILSLTARTQDYCRDVYEKLTAYNIRCEIDTRSEKIGYKIREAQLQKVPYMLILGDKEKENGEVAVRSRREGDLGAMSIDAFVQKILEEIRAKNCN